MLADRVRGIKRGKAVKLIDRSTPTLVVAQPYSTEGNGGRKLVRLENGWLVAGVKDGAILRLYISKNKGSSFELLGSTGGVALGDWTITSTYNNIHIVLQANTTNIASYSFDVATFIMGSGISSGTAKFAYIDQNQSTLDSCSLAINPQGTELHACWSSKNATYPNSFNIRYCKGIINGDGSVTWGSVEQVTISVSAAFNFINPCILFVDEPVIIIENQYNTVRKITALGLNLPGIGGSYAWRFRDIYDGGSYAQSSPSACVDKDGVIHVAWTRQTGVSTYDISHSKSIDGGVTWSMPAYASGGPIDSNPSIAVNLKNELFICHNNVNIVNRRKSMDGGMSWASIGGVSHTTSPAVLDDNSLGFDMPMAIYMSIVGHTTFPNSVVFSGKWYE